MSAWDGTAPTAIRRRRTSCIWMAIAAFALIINGVTVTVLLASDATPATTGVNGVFDNPRAASALRAAEELALGVVSLDAASGNPEVAALAERTTAKFRTDFDQFAGDFLAEVRTEGLEVRARVSAAGVSEMSEDRATVIVATSGEAIDTAFPVPRSRDFELRLVLTWIEDDWRVDGMEFL